MVSAELHWIEGMECYVKQDHTELQVLECYPGFSAFFRSNITSFSCSLLLDDSIVYPPEVH
jgi:hypothetical protein